jgi:hypothetical protein
MWLTRKEDGKENQGEDSPEVIPPEHALLNTKRDPSNGDQGGDQEEGQNRVCGARESARHRNDERGTDT